MVTRILRLKSPPQPADASDGVAAALAHLMAPRLPQISDYSKSEVIVKQ
jgi:Holliday junction resolvasome RuvABC endonuclease subunit